MNSIEKIHEFVNMARHPEAKDLKHALSLETKYRHCQYTVTDSIYIIEPISYYDIEDSIDKILGRPITAFDVCWALNKKQSEHYYFATDNGIWAGYELKDKCEGIIALMVEFKTKKPDGTDIFLTEWSDDAHNQLTELI